jgi:hypothetical protein
MRATGLLAFVLLLGPVLQTPVPRGVRQGEQADAQAQREIPPPLQGTHSVDAAQLQREADALASLAASVPPAIKQASHGVLPKDLPEKLKRIEKLSKRLRGEITR